MTDTQQQAPTGMQLIEAERERQIKAEGYTPRWDNQHSRGELASAAEYYIQATTPGLPWPWTQNPPKLSDQRSNYIKGGALLMAEVDRMERINAGRPPTCGFDVRNGERRRIMALQKRIRWVADRLDGKTTGNRQPIPTDIKYGLPQWREGCRFFVFANHINTPELEWYLVSQHRKEKTALETAKHFIRNERRRWFLVIDTDTMEIITE